MNVVVPACPGFDPGNDGMLAMPAQDVSVRTDNEDGVVKLACLRIPIGMAQENRKLVVRSEHTERVHPWIRLRTNPVCTEPLGKLVPGNTQLRRDNPVHTEFTGCRQSRLQKVLVIVDVTDHRRQM